MLEASAFWSYDPHKLSGVPDDILVEETLVYLDLPEIELLLRAFGRRKVKRVWLDSMVPQGDYLRTLNLFLAWCLFDIKTPARYLKVMETRMLNRRIKEAAK